MPIPSSDVQARDNARADYFRKRLHRGPLTVFVSEHRSDNLRTLDKMQADGEVKLTERKLYATTPPHPQWGTCATYDTGVVEITATRVGGPKGARTHKERKATVAIGQPQADGSVKLIEQTDIDTYAAKQAAKAKKHKTVAEVAAAQKSKVEADVKRVTKKAAKKSSKKKGK